MSPPHGAPMLSAMVTGAAIPTIAFEPHVLFSVVVPIVASWFGLVGIGVLAGKGVREIGRQLLGTILLGGIVGIVAFAVITAIRLEGIGAALATLTVAVSPVLAWRTLGEAAPRVIETALGIFGFVKRPDKERESHDDTGA